MGREQVERGEGRSIIWGMYNAESKDDIKQNLLNTWLNIKPEEAKKKLEMRECVG